MTIITSVSIVLSAACCLLGGATAIVGLACGLPADGKAGRFTEAMIAFGAASFIFAAVVRMIE